MFQRLAGRDRPGASATALVRVRSVGIGVAFGAGAGAGTGAETGTGAWPEATSGGARRRARSARAGRFRLGMLAVATCGSLGLHGCGREGDTPPTEPVPQVRYTSTLEPLDLVGVAPASGPGAPQAEPTWTVPAHDGDGAGAAELPPIVAPRSPVGMPRPTLAPTPVPGAMPPLVDPGIVALQAQVSAARLRSDVRSLSGFETRHALSGTAERTRGIGAARAWLAEEFERASAESIGQFTVEAEEFDLDWSGRVTRQQNIVGTLTGIGDRKRLVYVIAHYDSRTEDIADVVTDAPGAGDNASGAAALLELARVMGGRRWDASLRFMATAAKEPGLYGSRYHAPRARDIGMPIEGVFDNDGIGGVGSGDAAGTPLATSVRLLAIEPEDSPSRQLARWAAVIAERYGGLDAEVVAGGDPHEDGSDAEAFGEAGFAALRIASADADLGMRHSPSDTPDGLDPDYHAAVVRLNVALAGTLALAPPPPAVPPELAGEPAPSPSGDLALRWPPPSEPGVAGYWVGVRQVGAAEFALVRWAGSEGGLTISAAERPQGALAISLAASDGLGHMSLFGPELRID